MFHTSRFPTRAESRTVARSTGLARSAVEGLEARRLFAAGDLDPTFSGDGLAQIANTEAGRVATDVVALPGGKAFVVGIAQGGVGVYGHRAYLARYNANGTLDTTFSGDGRDTFDWGTADDSEARHVLVRPDGKIVVAGLAGDGSRTAKFVLGVALLNANGTFDTTFGGGDGKVLVDVPDADGDFIHTLSLASGNKLVAAVGGGGRPTGFGVMRLNANGTPDTSFGGDGFVNIDVGPFNDHVSAAAVAADGGIFAGGQRYLEDPNSTPGTAPYESSLIKLRSDGELDTTWGGGDGQVHGTFPQDSVLTLATAPGGKLVAGGHTAVARLNADGSPDNSFSGDGQVPRGGSAGPLRDMMVGPDGKVYTVAQSLRTSTGQDSSFVVVRFTAGGNLDSTWDGDGTAVTNFINGRDDPAAITLHSDGKVSVAGVSDPVEGDKSFETAVVARYTSGGRPDTTFSGDGRTDADFGSVGHFGGAVAVQADGKTIVAGTERRFSAASPATPTTDFFLARFTVGGTPDTSFSGDGRLTTDFGGNFDGVNDVLVQPDGKILALGYSGGDVALARYNASGSPDTSFSGDGKMTLGLGASDAGVKLALRSDGDIVLAANTDGHPEFDHALVRLNPNGSLDNGLNGNGIFRHNLGTVFTLQADNKILFALQGPLGGVYLTRLNTNGTTDTSYGDNGRTGINSFGDPEDTGARPRDLIMQGGNALVLAEATFDENVRTRVALFRWTPEGNIDHTFGFGEGAGLGRAAYGPADVYQEVAETVALDNLGRIVIGATAQVYDEAADNNLARYTVYRVGGADGAPDESFGPDGRRILLSSFTGGLSDLAVSPDGRPVAAGTYFTYSNFSSRGHGLMVARLQAGSEPPAGQTPFLGTPFRISDTGPTVIQAEDFDRGGEGVAYHDLTPATNTGGTYRTGEGVDIKATSDAGGGSRISDAMAGEWLEYTLDVVSGGAYDFQVRAGSPAAGGALHLEIDGTDVSGRMSVPNTGGYDAMQTITARGITLTEGRHVLRLALDVNTSTGAIGAVNWLRVVASTSIGTPVTLRAAADAHVRDGSSSGTNFGTAPELSVKRATVAGSTRETYLRFDLSSVAMVGLATLRLFGRLGDTSSLQTQVFSSSNTTWSETGLTWDNRPATGASPLGAITVIGTTSAWYEFDLTAFLQAEKSAGRNLVTLVLRNPTASSAQSLFASDEAATGRPELVVS